MPLAHQHGPHPENIDDDGREDWTAHFRMQASGLVEGDEQACIRVEIASIPFEGCDAVTILPGKAEGAVADAGEVSSPVVLQYVAQSPGCTIWLDCGWVWRPATE